MFCKNCGAQLEKDDSFCTNCGNPVTKDENETVVTNENINASNVENVAANSTVTTSEPIVQPTMSTPNLNGGNFNNKETIKKGASGNAVVIIIILFLLFAAIAVGVYFLFFNKTDKNSVEAIESAVNNMNEINSYTLVASLEMEGKEDGQDVGISLETNIDSKNKKAKLDASISASGASMEFLGYVDVSDSEDAKVYLKLPEYLLQEGSNEWQKISLGEIDLDSLMEEEIAEEMTEEEKEKIRESLKKIDFIKSVKSDVSGTKLYKATIDKAVLKKLIEEFDDIELTEEELEEMDFEGKIIIDIYVNKKENYLSKLVIHLKDFYNNLEETEDELRKFDIIIEYKNINKVKEIEIPSDALKAEEMDLSSTGLIPGGDSDIDIDVDTDLEEDDDVFVEDYALTKYGYKVKYNLDSDYEASSVNSADFKIYHADNISAILTMRMTELENCFEDIEFDKKYYEESDSYINISLSDAKKVTVAGKEFTYKTLTYKYNSEYGLTYYDTVFCYKVDDDHVYMVTYEKKNEPLTDEEMKTFLDVEITKE